MNEILECAYIENTFFVFILCFYFELQNYWIDVFLAEFTCWIKIRHICS